MSKEKLIADIAESAGLPKSTVDKVLVYLAAVVANELSNRNEVVIHNLVKLTAVDVAERKGRNPSTGEAIVIPAHTKVVTKPRGLLSTLFKSA